MSTIVFCSDNRHIRKFARKVLHPTLGNGNTVLVTRNPSATIFNLNGTGAAIIHLCSMNKAEELISLIKERRGRRFPIVHLSFQCEGQKSKRSRRHYIQLRGAPNRKLAAQIMNLLIQEGVIEPPEDN